MPQLILASGSPRRAELLSQIGVTFSVDQADIDETPQSNESPEQFVRRLAAEKAHVVLQKHSDRNPIAVLGSDTVVLSQQRILGKPLDYLDFQGMMSSLSGTSHQVLTAVSVRSRDVAGFESGETIVCATTVYFKRLREQEIDTYWRSGEPKDKAGGYGIQGLAACFIERIEGSYSNVVGLPLFETYQLLQRFSISTWLEQPN